MKQVNITITQQHQAGRDYRRLRFPWPATAPRPGEFLTLKSLLPDGTLLRRPFAFSAWDEARGEAEILYQVKGAATKGYSRLREGESLNALGPLGRGFTFPPEANQRSPLIMTGGGIGTGPVLFSAREAARQGHEPLLILGFRTAADVPREVLPEDPRITTVICTDDGSEGFHGTTADCLSARLKEMGQGESTLKSPTRKAQPMIRSCGPYPMMKALHEIALKTGAELEVSMEEMMACGVGVCNGCALPLAGSTPERPLYKKACTDGPVFNSREILWR